MRNGNKAADAAPISPPTFPADLASAHRFLLDTETCRVWSTETGLPVRTEWARGRGLPRLVFAADCRPQLGAAAKRGLSAMGIKVDEGAPRWPSTCGQSGITYGATEYKLGDLKAVPRGRPANTPPPTYLDHLRALNGADFAMPRFVPIEPIADADDK